MDAIALTVGGALWTVAAVIVGGWVERYRQRRVSRARGEEAVRRAAERYKEDVAVEAMKARPRGVVRDLQAYRQRRQEGGAA